MTVMRNEVIQSLLFFGKCYLMYINYFSFLYPLKDLCLVFTYHVLYSRLTISQEELKPYCFIDANKNYTRNLIATDDETFTLLILCWNSGKYSPIHDHPCDGCWMRVCRGVVNEVRYRKEVECEWGGKGIRGNQDYDSNSHSTSKSSSKFVCTMDSTFHEGDLTFIHDDIGYHKVSEDFV